MTPEGQILKAVLDYLAARHILAFRMNTGSLKDSRGIPVRFGTPGMADVLAFPQVNGYPDICWIECKAAKGKQSPLQRSFQEQVEKEGHRYVVARSIEDLAAAL
jgi:hypothetical protein